MSVPGADVQNITILVEALMLPAVAAPICVFVARWVWMRHRVQGSRAVLQLLLASLVETILWIGCAIALGWALVTERYLESSVALVLAAGVGWLLSGFWLDRGRRWSRVAYIAMIPIILAGLGLLSLLLINVIGR